MLSRDLATRCGAIAITVVLIWLLGSGRYWVGLVISFGLAHYLLSFYYAAGRMRGLVASPMLPLPLVSLVLLLLDVYFLKFPLEIYFGIHHACNEGYLRRYLYQATGTADPQLPAFRKLFHLAAYLCILLTTWLKLGSFVSRLFTVLFLELRPHHRIVRALGGTPRLDRAAVSPAASAERLGSLRIWVGGIPVGSDPGAQKDG